MPRIEQRPRASNDIAGIRDFIAEFSMAQAMHSLTGWTASSRLSHWAAVKLQNVVPGPRGSVPMLASQRATPRLRERHPTQPAV
jgi:hypothetical protein